ncbi:hypothetical protein JOC83_000564 [Bacillus iocasae]|uniref:Uncharacterized protein n=1 Tax=Priestia iocasae TaxID=2291674 RepID=A0ABS2QQZ3_9BACI|nr:hypothetical protein [Metabacillus iocasae]
MIYQYLSKVNMRMTSKHGNHVSISIFFLFSQTTITTMMVTLTKNQKKDENQFLSTFILLQNILF